MNWSLTKNQGQICADLETISHPSSPVEERSMEPSHSSQERGSLQDLNAAPSDDIVARSPSYYRDSSDASPPNSPISVEQTQRQAPEIWPPTDLACPDSPAEWSQDSREVRVSRANTPPQETLIQPSSPTGNNHPACSPDPIPPKDMSVILNMSDNPPRLEWWNTKDIDGLQGPHSAPVRLADRKGRTKLRSGRDRAAPYTNGVFRFRMGIDYRAP